MNDTQNRGPWYLFTGLALGLAIGLAYAWNFQPLQTFDTAPIYLRANFKDEYRALVSVAFMASGNLVRAEQRLGTLQDADPVGVLALQAGRWPMEDRPVSESQALAVLAATLLEAAKSAEVLSNTPPAGGLDPEQPAVPTLTSTLLPPAGDSPTPAAPTLAATTPPSNRQATPTLLPTRTPTATPGGAFVLDEQTLLCDTDPGDPLIVFNVLDASGNPVPGVEISVTWAGGEERFFTGLKPEFGLGYADFTMTPGERYTILLQPAGSAASQPLTGLEAQECEQDGRRYWGVWKLVFVQR